MSTLQINDTTGKAARLVSCIKEEIEAYKEEAEDLDEENDEYLPILIQALMFTEQAHTLLQYAETNRTRLIEGES